MSGPVIVGQEFKCKRRNHIVKVEVYDAEMDTVHYRNRVGALVGIRLGRLLDPSRFELVVQPATITGAEAGC